MKKETKLWFDYAEESFQDALYSLKGRRYGNACFCSQQALEKILKAILVKEGIRPPKSHDLIHLLDLTKLEVDKKIKTELKTLTRHYFLVRYPDISRRFFRSPLVAKKNIKFLKKFYPWLKKILEK